MSTWSRYKRGIDLVVLVLGHLVLSPLFIVVWIAVPLWIWAEDRGPIFYTQNRVGLNGRVFKIVKFRSMVVGADRLGPAWTTHDDPRRTRVGRVLRTRGLDELPELLSVWRGDLSLVGPRPLNVEEHATMCQEVADFPKRLTVRPGVTGLAQLYNRSDDPYSKLDFDLKYIREMSPALDLRLIVESIRYVVFGRIDDRSSRE